MDAVVAQAMAKWPNVPAVYGWLALDRRGNWLIKGERITNPALRDFIARNYESDGEGRWFFQNGPQRVYVSLAYTPWVVRHEADGVVDHCGRPFQPNRAFLDDEGSVLLEGGGRIALVDDRDLERYAEREASLIPIRRTDVAGRFGFIPDPRPQ